MISTFTLFVILLLIFAVVTVVIIYLISRSHSSRVNNFARSRGLNMVDGQTKTLKCENGRKICVYRATEICTSRSKFEDVSTDPISDGLNGSVYGSFDPNTTVSRTSDVKNMCNGKESCDFTFRASGQILCGGQTQLIGTYSCMAPGSECSSYD